MPTITKPGKPTVRTAMGLFGVLQRHGLTIDVLQVWVEFLETKKTGLFTFHVTNGQLKAYEEHSHAAIAKGDRKNL